MKDVNEILRRCLQTLEVPFSSAWLSDFSDFIRFVHTNELTVQILKEIKNQKEEACAPLERHLRGLLEDGKKCLQELRKAFHFNEDITRAILALLKTKINSKEIANPFLDLESIYRKYCADFASLFKLITEEGLTAAIPKYCHQNGSNLNSTTDSTRDLAFSPYFQKCERDIEVLSGQRATSAWGRWDELMKWAEWAKKGIPTTNDEFRHNLANMFQEYKISEAVQSFGLFFLE